VQLCGKNLKLKHKGHKVQHKGTLREEKNIHINSYQ